MGGKRFLIRKGFKQRQEDRFQSPSRKALLHWVGSWSRSGRARDLAKHPTENKTGLHNKELCGPRVSGAKAEKPAINIQ